MRVTKHKVTLTAISALLLLAIVPLSGQRAFAQRLNSAAAPASSRASIKLPDMPAAAERVLGSVSGPEQIDDVTKRAGLGARLLNFNLATPVDLSYAGLGKVVHIPVQISEREGGRKSLYFLNPGEEVLAGVFVTDDGLALRYVKRLDGKGTPARTGDMYQTRVTTAQGKAIFQEQGRLEVIDAAHGRGQLVPLENGGATGQQRTSVWIAWSCILIVRDKKATN
ncbi:MAG TPA: hypothetical protein VF544_17030 [Pyrinomonadaceae bacterium]|jgi:hypothetical protein